MVKGAETCKSLLSKNKLLSNIIRSGYNTLLSTRTSAAVQSNSRPISNCRTAFLTDKSRHGALNCSNLFFRSAIVDHRNIEWYQKHKLPPEPYGTLGTSVFFYRSLPHTEMWCIRSTKHQPPQPNICCPLVIFNDWYVGNFSTSGSHDSQS